jgi:hypothetical protein
MMVAVGTVAAASPVRADGPNKPPYADSNGDEHIDTITLSWAAKNAAMAGTAPEG